MQTQLSGLIRGFWETLKLCINMFMPTCLNEHLSNHFSFLNQESLWELGVVACVYNLALGGGDQGRRVSGLKLV